MKTISKITAVVILFLISCQKHPTDISQNQYQKKVDIPFKIQVSADIKPFVYFASAQVTASDMDTIITELKVNQTSVEGIIEEVPSGKNRFFEIFVYSKDTILTYYGSKYSNVYPAQINLIEIILKPVSDTGTVIIIGYFGLPQNEKIVYSTFDYQLPFDDGEIFIMNPDGTEKYQLTYNPGADYHEQISPNRNKIAFVRNLDPDGHDSHIFLMNFDGTDQTQLTFGPIREDGPWFSPQGDKIAFRKTTPNGKSNIFVMNLDGSGLVNLTQDKLDALHPVWANDGNIYFVTHGSDNRIWKIRPDGSDLKVVSPFKVGAHQRIQFTNNMEFIFFDSYEYPNQIVRCDFPTFTNSKYITTGDDIGGFCLSPSNDKIIYSQGSHQNGYYLFIKDLNNSQIDTLNIKAIDMDWKEIFY